MKISDLNPEYDKLQQEYGAKELTSIYNGGCTNNPDICFVFINPTRRNIALALIGKVEAHHGQELKIYGNYFIELDYLTKEYMRKFKKGNHRNGMKTLLTQYMMMFSLQSIS